MTQNTLPLSRTEQCVLREVRGFTPQMGQLVHMLEYVRHNTADVVKDLSVQQLDTLIFPDGNTIGMLLAHIAGIERSYQGITFEGKRPDGTLPEFKLGEVGRQTFQALPVHDYLEELRVVREVTLSTLRQKDDEWLTLTYQPWGNRDWNNHFCWFHVLEDELRHQGQIVILKKEIARRQNQS